MNNIKTAQSLPENMRLLKAQRVLYADAKRIYRIQLTITIIIVVILNFVRVIAKQYTYVDLTPYIALISGGITLFDLAFLTGYLSRFKTNAAKVQELFDCNIYKMKWNDTNCGDKPENSIIEEAEKKYIYNSKSPLTNWYHIDLDGLEHQEAVLRCQETNVEYDRKLRFHFKNDCTFVSILIVIGSFIVATIIDASLRGYIVYFIAPTMPLIVILIKIILDNMKAAKALEEVRNSVKKLRLSKSRPSMTQLRKVQDKLYISRRDSSLIPDNYYQYRRPKLEQSTKVNAVNQK